MSKRACIAAGTLIGSAATGIGLMSLGRFAMQRRIENEVHDLYSAAADTQPSVVTDADPEHLPEPVRRWLRWANVVGRENPARVRLSQEGEFRLREDQAWMPFTAT